MMSPEEIKEFIRGGAWVSIATEIRPSAAKTASGAPQPFYCSRRFVYSAPDAFECTVMNYADANGRIPLDGFRERHTWQVFEYDPKSKAFALYASNEE
jgi:hypothetical protein